MANRVLAAELLVAPVGVGQPFAVQLHQLAEALLFCRQVSECVVPPKAVSTEPAHRLLEVLGRAFFRRGLLCSLGAVCRRDLAVTAFPWAGHLPGRHLRRQAAYEAAQVLYEPPVDRIGRDVHHVVGVGHLAGDAQPLVALQCAGKGVHVDQHLGGVGRTGTAGLGVDDRYLVPSPGDQVGLASQHGTAAPEVEGVLPFGQYRVALLLPPLTLLVKQGGVVQEPAGLVEVRGHAAPAPSLVLGLEPAGPFAGTFSGEQPGQPCDPQVGSGGAELGHNPIPSAFGFGDTRLQSIGASRQSATGNCQQFRVAVADR